MPDNADGFYMKAAPGPFDCQTCEAPVPLLRVVTNRGCLSCKGRRA